MQTSVRKPTRDKQINIRATDEERAVIDYAASLVNKNRTIDAKARAFYEYFGFAQSPIATNMLFYKL